MRTRCKHCAQLINPQVEKALDHNESMVWVSEITGDWICQETGDEHDPFDNALEQLNAFEAVIDTALGYVDDGTLDAEVAMNLLRIGTGRAARSARSMQVGDLVDRVSRGELPASALTDYLKEDQ